MKIKIYNILFILVMITLVSCYEDKGNYTYSDSEVIKIDSIKSVYEIISGVDSVKIYPMVKSTIPGAEFEYKWSIYELGAVGRLEETVIGHEQNLENIFHLKATSWGLVFTAKNKKTGYSVTFESKIVVVTAYTRGWYVLKSDGKDTDIDLFQTKDTIIPNPVPIKDIMFNLHGRRAKGKPVKISMSTDYYTLNNITNKYFKTRSLFILSQNDIFANTIETMDIARDASNINYLETIDYEPNAFCCNMSDFFLINKNKLYAIFNTATNDGRFGVEKLLNAAATEYNLSKYVVCGAMGNVMFDNTTSSFVAGVSHSSTLQYITDTKLTEMPSKNTNLECIYMGGLERTFGAKACGIFRDKTTKEKKILSITLAIPMLNTIELSTNTKVKPESRIYSADIVTASTDENILYFHSDGMVMSLNLSNGLDKKEFVLPQGEKISFISHQQIKDGKFSFNYVLIGTNKEGNYKIYMFTKKAGSLLSAADIVIEGVGECADIIYISPNVKSNSIPYL